MTIRRRRPSPVAIQTDYRRPWEIRNEDLEEAPRGTEHKVDLNLDDKDDEKPAIAAGRTRKGKTRMPMRLVRREAIVDLGYPYNEDGEYFVLGAALDKEQIDDIIEASKAYGDGSGSPAKPTADAIQICANGTVLTVSGDAKIEVRNDEEGRPQFVVASASSRDKAHTSSQKSSSSR